VVGCEGAADIVVPDMSDDEAERLERSAVMLRGACHEISTSRD
jgi:hypothetical protein